MIRRYDLDESGLLEQDALMPLTVNLLLKVRNSHRPYEMDLDCFSCICQVDLKMEIVTPPGFLSDNQERIDSLVNELEATAHIAPPPPSEP